MTPDPVPDGAQHRPRPNRVTSRSSDAFAAAVAGDAGPRPFSGPRVCVSERHSVGCSEREEASLRRVAAAMRAEADELPPGCWVRRKLESDIAVGGWGDVVLPLLTRLVQDDDPEPDRWTHPRDRSPLAADEEAVLRRLGAVMRAEAAELATPGSGVARRLDGWGIRLFIACADERVGGRGGS